MAGAAALDARRSCERTNKDNLLILFEGQQGTLIFQQHRTLRRNVCRSSMVLIQIYANGLFVLQAPGNPYQKALCCTVQYGFVQCSIPHGLHQLLVIDATRGGHLQLQSRTNGLHAVVHGAPVGHHNAIKSPLLPQYVRQQPGVFAGVDAVDQVVGAHDAFGAASSYGSFKSRKINLAQRTLRYDAVYCHAAELLAIGREMLYTGRHALFLQAGDIRCG